MFFSPDIFRDMDGTLTRHKHTPPPRGPGRSAPARSLIFFLGALRNPVENSIKYGVDRNGDASG